MPDAKNNAKLTGDTHPPEVEDALPGLSDDLPEAAAAEGDSDRGRGSDAGTPGRDINQAGFVKDRDLGGKPGKDQR